jgi:hypothetical protein
MALLMLWLRAYGIEEEVVWQTDWEEEFGGSNPTKLHKLQAKHYAPVGAKLSRIPLGRKEHNGRVERSHRTDDEEFYPPFLGKLRTEDEFLRKAVGWSYLLQPRAAPLRGGDGRKTAVPGAAGAGARSARGVRPVSTPCARSHQCRLGPQGW